MKINIQPMRFGISSDFITSVELQWGSKPFYGDSVTLNILAFNQNGNLVQEEPKCMSMTEYMVLGETKEERADAILKSNGIKIKDEDNGL